MYEQGNGKSYKQHRFAALAVAGAAITLSCSGNDSSALLAPTAINEPSYTRAVSFSGWSPAVSVESLPGTSSEFNTAFLDGCPIRSRDNKKFFMASTRPGGLGGIDIWVSTRSSERHPWGAPVNLGAPINSAADDFCPTPDRDGRTFFFVSARPTWSGGASCGGPDIYVTRFRRDGSAEDPQNLGCDWNGGVNSAGAEASPSPLPESGNGRVLYFSSERAGGFAADAAGAVSGDPDIYVSHFRRGRYGRATLVPGVNTEFADSQPNVRRDGLEIFFFSTRPGGFGAQDIYSSTRMRTSRTWSAPVNLGANVNTAAGETRPSISWDGRSLVFGSSRPGEGVSDIYITTRERLSGGEEGGEDSEDEEDGED